MTTEPGQPRSRERRQDIQALRGFAVVIVLCYHARIGLIDQGYLGVDVFFVISGFVITGLISSAIADGRFRLAEFYFTRAQRLLPAAYTTFLLTALIAPFVLTSLELADFRAQMAGAITFTENFVLLHQSGYFTPSADLKPLLHAWSLAVEEQYYLILPALLLLLPRRYWLATSLGIVALSIAACVLLAGHETAFWLLPTRMFELTLGSIAAMVASDLRVLRFAAAAFWPALALLLATPLIEINSFHPGPAAIIICAATALILLRGHPLLQQGPLIRLLAWLGDLSYSLYLAHWPLQAFFNNIWVGASDSGEPTIARALLIGLALPLAYALHRWVEQPARHAALRRSLPAALAFAAGSAALVLLPYGALEASSVARQFVAVRRANLGLDASCAATRDFEPTAPCRTSQSPELLVWGDSYAMHLVAGIEATAPARPALIQATRSVCGPLLDLALLSAHYRRGWAESCIRFNDSVVTYLRHADSVRTVVLSSPFNQYVSDMGELLKREPGNHYHVVKQSIEEALAGLERTISVVRGLGKRVVIVAPPPSDDFDLGRCGERLARGWPMLGGDPLCRISVALYHRESAAVLELLRALPQRLNTAVIRFDPYLCDGSWCQTFVDGTLIYRDSDHLSYEGSRFLASRMRLVEQIDQAAR